MKKFLYDMMMKEYEKLSKEELGQKIMSLEEIECEDRCFANECMAGPLLYKYYKVFILRSRKSLLLCVAP